MPDPLLTLLLAAVGAGLFWLLFRPERGLWDRWRTARADSKRVRREDALKHLYKCELEGTTPTVDGLAGALRLSRDEAVRLLQSLEEDGLSEVSGGRIHLTPQGQTSAIHIIRAHRLWERYLADETGFEQQEWHERADFREHFISLEEADQLAAALGHPTHDPHGDPIPTSAGRLQAHGGKPLSTAPLNRPLRVVHIEDEPEIVYAQLLASGVHPGMVLRVLESTPARVRFLSEGNEHVLAPIVAGNVSVAPLPEPHDDGDEGVESLAHLQPGESGRVVGLSPACRGAERRRFLDLGILPGTMITAELRSAAGDDPTAYRIRGALIALRREQAALVRVRRCQEVAHQGAAP
ncbi:MAG: iron dependent repressor, metal binding and dimerization domain protein [bacterium]